MKLTPIQQEVLLCHIKNLRNKQLNPMGLSVYSENEIANLVAAHQSLQETRQSFMYTASIVNKEIERIQASIPNDCPELENILKKILICREHVSAINIMKKIVRLEAALNLSIDLSYMDVIDAVFTELFENIVSKTYRDPYIVSNIEPDLRRRLTIP